MDAEPGLDRALVQVGLVSAVVSAIVVLVWVGVMQLSDPWLFVPLVVGRLVLTLALLHAELRPVAAFMRARARERCDDQLLLDIDARFQALPHRHVAFIMLPWLAVGVVALAAGALGWGPSFGPVQWLSAGLTIPAVCMAAPIFEVSSMFAAVRSHQLVLGRELIARKLEPPRPQMSRANELARLILFLPLVLVLVACATGLSLRSEAIHAQLQTELLGRVQAVALAPEAPLPEQTTIVDGDALPVGVASASTTWRTGFDADSGQVWAATALADGRWAFATTTPDEQLGVALALIGTLLVIAGFPALELSRSTAESIIGPVRELEVLAREVVEVGRLGQIARVVPLRNDELGAITRSFNVMLDTFEELARAAQTVGRGNLAVSFARRGDLGDAFRAMLSHLNDMVDRMDETTLELVSVASELLAATEAHSLLVQEQSSHARAMSSSTAVLASAATQIDEAATAVLGNAEQTADRAMTTLTQIRELDSQARGIRDLLELIHEIADRSDLLALNGSLEAVRAGEAGRGFALVAVEMRRLAERVGNLVVDIRTRIGNIERSTEATMSTTEHSRTLAQHTAGVAREINDAIGEQTRRTAEVAELTHELALGVQAVERGLAQTRATAAGLRHHAETLEAITRQFRRDS